MNSMILVPILLLSFFSMIAPNCPGEGCTDLCENYGQKVVEAELKVFNCMKTTLKDTGAEGKTKKCPLNFVGPRGHEADKKYCKENNKVYWDWADCTDKYRDEYAKNDALRDCLSRFDKKKNLP